MSSNILKLWLLIAVIGISWSLGGYPLFDADEGRNGEVAREMAATNDYVLPRLNTLPYLDKPIVYFAAAAGAMEVLGPTETAARLPALLFTFMTAALVGWFGRRLWGANEGWIAAIAFLSMPLTLAFGRTVIFDSALTFFIALAITSFHAAISTRDKRWATLAWAAIALGVLTKGPVAILVPLLVAIPFAVKRKAAGTLWSVWGIVAFVAVVAPWVWAVSQKIPEFLRYVVVTETAERMATKALKRTGPPWYFIPYLLGGALPWSVVAFFGARRKPEDEDGDTRAFLLLWLLVPLLFFSISQSKRPQYILPLMPAVALLGARAWRSDRQPVAARYAAAILVALGAVLVAAPSLPEFSRKMESGVAEPARFAAMGLGAAFLVGGIAALVAARQHTIALLALSLPILAIPLTTGSLMRAIGVRRSAQAFATQLRPHLTAQTRIIGIEAYTGSMSFYLGRPILLASDDASELTSNYLIRRYSQYASNPFAPLRPVSWFDRTLGECCEPRIYVVRNDDLQRRALLEKRGLRLVASGAHHVAFR